MTGETRFGDPVDELWSALAEGEAEAPPEGLGERILDAALRGRRAGRPVTEVPAISPLEAYREQVRALDSLLTSLSDAEWSRPALRDLDVQGLVGHLIGVEADFHRALGAAGVSGGEAAPSGGDGVDHIASTQPFAIAQSGRTGEQTRADWRSAAEAIVERLEPEGSARFSGEVTLHGLPLPLGAWLTVRAFELWTHDEDIRRATGRQLAPPGESALRLMTDLAVALLPAAMARTGTAGTGDVARLVLTGAAGGCWTIAPGPAGPPATRIVADTVDFCRVAAARVRPDALRATITGDRRVAVRVLEAAFSLALD